MLAKRGSGPAYAPSISWTETTVPDFATRNAKRETRNVEAGGFWVGVLRRICKNLLNDAPFDFRFLLRIESPTKARWCI
jgi:hypothetical protein